MANMLKLTTFAAITATLTSPLLAGPPVPVPAAPGPLVGAGIPALIAIGYVYKRIRDSREG